MPVWKDAGDEVCVAVLFVARDFAVSKVNDEDIVIVVTLTVAGEVFAQRLHNDDRAAINNAGRDGCGSLTPPICRKQRQEAVAVTFRTALRNGSGSRPKRSQAMELEKVLPDRLRPSAGLVL